MSRFAHSLMEIAHSLQYRIFGPLVSIFMVILRKNKVWPYPVVCKSSLWWESYVQHYPVQSQEPHMCLEQILCSLLVWLGEELMWKMFLTLIVRAQFSNVLGGLGISQRILAHFSPKTPLYQTDPIWSSFSRIGRSHYDAHISNFKSKGIFFLSTLKK